jgi:GTP-binding protein
MRVRIHARSLEDQDWEPCFHGCFLLPGAHDKIVKPTPVEFVASVFTPRDFPPAGMPEIVMAGRSNVGKSSLINRLVGIKGLARTSAMPGKTRSVNFFRCRDSFYLVDLPGFGYAKGKSGSREWKSLVESYFGQRRTIALVLHLVDARMPPTHLDVQFAAWLQSLKLGRLVVATKADKLSGNERVAGKRAIHGVFPGTPVIFSSAVTGIGCKEIWNRVAEAAHDHETTRENPES